MFRVYIILNCYLYKNDLFLNRPLILDFSFGNFIKISQINFILIYIYSVVIPENFPQYKLDDSNLHEAAYDAYITGICFTAMSNFLGSYGALLIFFFFKVLF